jgi:glycosyltransferase involved in cell wall biosynthesis
MALGTPVATIDTPASVEVLGGCGWVARPTDVAGAARTIRDALTNDDLRRERTRAARQRIQTGFTLEQTVALTIDVYAKMATLASGSPTASAPMPARAEH